MSTKEFKAPRALPEIQADYQRLCSQSGQLQYQVYAIKRDLDVINEQIRDLNFEGAAAQQALAKAQKEAEEVKAKEDAQKAAAETKSEAPKLAAVPNQE